MAVDDAMPGGACKMLHCLTAPRAIVQNKHLADSRQLQLGTPNFLDFTIILNLFRCLLLTSPRLTLLFGWYPHTDPTQDNLSHQFNESCLNFTCINLNFNLLKSFQKQRGTVVRDNLHADLAADQTWCLHLQGLRASWGMAFINSKTLLPQIRQTKRSSVSVHAIISWNIRTVQNMLTFNIHHHSTRIPRRSSQKDTEIHTKTLMESCSAGWLQNRTQRCSNLFPRQMNSWDGLIIMT